MWVSAWGLNSLCAPGPLPSWLGHLRVWLHWQSPGLCSRPLDRESCPASPALSLSDADLSLLTPCSILLVGSRGRGAAMLDSPHMRLSATVATWPTLVDWGMLSALQPLWP